MKKDYKANANVDKLDYDKLVDGFGRAGTGASSLISWYTELARQTKQAKGDDLLQIALDRFKVVEMFVREGKAGLKDLFTKEEMFALVQSFNGTLISPHLLMDNKYIIAELEDADRYESTLSKFGVELSNISNKLANLSGMATLSLLTDISEYWNRHTSKEIEVYFSYCITVV